MIVAWFSAGITSAVACKLALEKYYDVKVVFIETGNHHTDNARFISDCEKWFGVKIEIIQSIKYDSVQDVILSTKYINGVYGAPCTKFLKREVRQKVHIKYRPKKHILGFEYEKHEINRANRFQSKHPEANAIFPLIDAKLNKDECAGILAANGIELPVMYKLGYEHNNCIGCVKGGKGYWNMIRKDFPDVFLEMAEIEREVGASCINGTYLDELNESEGLKGKPVMPNCGIFCTHFFL